MPKSIEVAITGQKIIGVREMTDAEMQFEGWDEDNLGGKTMVLVLANGIKLYASRDEEGNGPGAMFGVRGGGQAFRV